MWWEEEVRERTVKRFIECEAKRVEARALGLNEDGAHEVAKEHWNAWADDMFAKRNALKERGVWEPGKVPLESFAKNTETDTWFAEA